MSMKPWWQVAIPHRDIREGRISDFAADLSSILRREAAIEYQDPETFFKRTHLTKGLENIIRDVLLVLSGKERSKIILIQTPFGGGKTHALISLYHLINSGEKVSHIGDVRKVLESIGLAEVPKAKVAVFVGSVPDPLRGKTPWGEIADQLGAYEVVKEHDMKRVTPGRETLETLFKMNKPLLILIDELALYIVKAREFEDQVLAFLQELTEAVRSSEQCVLLCTLPSSVPYGERGERVLSQLQRILGRMQTIYTPVEGEEIYEILRKRLFEDLGDRGVHEVVAGEYFELYRSLGEEVPREAREIEYREKIKKAYPFHPELIDVLFERWGTIPSFQRTRGVLRLLAEIIFDLFTRQDPSPLIQPSNINLANPRIRRMFIEHIGEVFESVVASDIAGENAKAVKMDRHLGKEYVRFRVASGLATSIFFYSFSGGERRGVSAQRLRLAFLRKEIPPAIVGDVLKRLEDELLYLHVEKNLYYFDSKVGLNRLIVDIEEAIREDDIIEEAKRRIEEIAGKDFEIFIWPRTSADIPDNKKLKLIILPLDLAAGDPRTEEFIQNVLTFHSTGFRTYKNTLVFLMIDPKEYDALRRAVRRFLALKAIKDDTERMRTLTEEDRDRLDRKLEDAKPSIDSKILSAYRYIAKASKEGIKTFDMGIPTAEERLKKLTEKERLKKLAERVRDYLKDQDILLEKLSPKALLEKTFSKEDKRKSLAEIWEAFLRYPELPMLESENVVKSAIAQGVREGVFGIIDGDKVRYSETVPIDKLVENTIVVRKEIAEEIKKKVEGMFAVTEPGIPTEKAPEIEPVLEKTTEKAPEIEPVLEKRTLKHRRIKIRAKVPWDKLSDVVRGVFSPLISEGAQIALEVTIDAQSEKGISRDTVDHKIRETFNQIGAQIIEEEVE